MQIEEIIKFFGNQRGVAIALGIKEPSVFTWKKNGKIPMRRQYQIEKLTKGELKADAE